MGSYTIWGSSKRSRFNRWRNTWATLPKDMRLRRDPAWRARKRWLREHKPLQDRTGLVKPGPEAETTNTEVS